MKKYVFLFALALVWGCQDRAMGPNEAGQTDITEYGSSVINIPGLAGLPGLAKAAPGTVYTFQLVITGSGMDPMTFSFPLGGKDTAVVINKIPAGSSRLFTGILYSQQGPTHEGSAMAEIRAGQTAFVKLFLRKTGSAQVDVIIEGVNDDTAGGCYMLGGRIDTIALDGSTLKIIGNDGSQLWAYVYQGGEMVGKFWGTFDYYKNFTGEISMPGIPGIAMFKGAFTPDYNAFKGEVFSMDDTLKSIGIMYGYSGSCDTIEPPAPDTGASGCFKLGGYIDTLRLDGYVIKILEHSGSQLWAYVYQGAEMIGKFWGTFDYSMRFTGEISVPGIPDGIAMFKGAFSSDYSAFKGEVYSMYDTTKLLGVMDGFTVVCDTIEPPPPSSCQTDTMGGLGSCKDIDTWVRYATDACKQSGLTLGGYTFMGPCGNGSEKTFSSICYECCKANVK